MSHLFGPQVSGGAQIRFPDQETMTVDGLCLTDPELVETIKDWGRTYPRGKNQALHDLPRFVAGLLSLGGRTYAGGRSSTSAGIITAAASEAGKTINTSVTAVSDQVSRATEDIRDAVSTEVTRLVEEITEKFGAEGSPATAAVRESLKGTATEMAAGLSGRLEAAVAASVRAGLDSVRGEVRSVGDAVSRVRDHLMTSAAADTAAADSVSRSAIKGVEFEETMNTVMDTLAAEASREYLVTGTQQGQAVGTGSVLKGDGVWIHDGHRVAIEFHNGMSRSRHGDTHQQGWNRYLSEAMKNREATAGLGVVASPEQNKGRQVRGFGTNMAVIACDPSDQGDVDRLRFMLVVMEMVARNHANRSGAGSDALTRADLMAVSVRSVRRCLDEFHDGLATIVDLERHATRTESSAVQLRETAFTLRTRLAGTLARALAETDSQADILGVTVAAVGSRGENEGDFEVASRTG